MTDPASPRKTPPLFILLVAVVLGVGLGLLAFRPVARWMESRRPEPQPSPVGLQTIEEVLGLLQDEYIRTLDTRELLNGSVEALRGTLKAKGIQGAALPDLPASPDRKRLLEAYGERFREAETRAAGKVERADLTYAALEGLVSKVGDPYTMVMDPKQFQRLEEQMKGGNFGGVGIYLEADPRHAKRLTVVEPIEDSPAAAAGVQTGDWITAIDGEDTAGMDIEAAATRIRGPVGTRVVLTLKRKDREPFQVTLQRQKIHVKSATWKMLPEGVGYVRLRFFGEDTREEFAEALAGVRARGARGLVVDLRNNGGGYINAALDVCSNFVKQGDLVVSVVNPRVERSEPHAAGKAQAVGIPTVLLVNRFSASASEITAGALKDYRAATLVGEKTFGKASVQQLHVLSDGGALKYTIAHYLTPRGRDIHRQGIEPDVQVEAEPSNKLGEPGDKQLEAALQVLEKKMAGSADAS